MLPPFPIAIFVKEPIAAGLFDLKYALRNALGQFLRMIYRIFRYFDDHVGNASDRLA